MARIRTIKPEFWTDAALIECSLNARLLFIGTWNFADDYGNLDRSPKQIKARVFPADTIDCEPLIHELITHGLLTEYSVNGSKYLHVQGFTKHQVVNRPGKPVCPAFNESLVIHAEFTESSLIALAGREGKGKERNTLSGKPDVSRELLDYLNAKAGRKYQPVKANLSLIKARLAEGNTAEQIRKVIDRKVAEWKNNPEMSQYLRPETLFGATKFAGYVGQVDAPIAGEKSWWETANGIEFKGKELGLERSPDEQFPFYKQRVFSQAGDGPWMNR